MGTKAIYIHACISADSAPPACTPTHGRRDYFFDKNGVSNGGNRYATVLMYLMDTDEGGETVFPNIAAPGGVNEGFSECAKYHLAAKPRKGDGERGAARGGAGRGCDPL